MAVAPSNGGFPHTIWYRVSPKEQNAASYLDFPMALRLRRCGSDGLHGQP